MSKVTPETLKHRIEGNLKDLFESRNLPLYDMMSYHFGLHEDALSKHAGFIHGSTLLLSMDAFGGKVDRANEIVHGKTSIITHIESPLFAGLPEKFEATRYHSLVALKESFPVELKITAETDNGLIMALEHREYPIYGVQFHPESIVTEHGMKMVENFLKV